MLIDKSSWSEHEWLMQRKKYLGASEAGIVLGMSKWKSPYVLWQEKMSDDVDMTRSGPAWLGIVLEDHIVEKFAADNGIPLAEFEKPSCMHIDDAYPFLSANLDRIHHSADGDFVVEVKSVGGFAEKAWESEVPLSYFVQIQVQMYNSGITRGYFLVCNKDSGNIRKVDVDYDADFMGKVLPILDEWWRNYVIARVPPPYESSDAAVIEPVEGSSKDCDDEMAKVVEVLRQKKAEKSALDAEVKELENQVKGYILEAETLQYHGVTLATYKLTKKKPYSVPATQYRTLRLKGE